MVDFLCISTRSRKKGVVEVYPKFAVKLPSQDLMIRNGDFYAVWVEEKGKWSTSEQDVIDIVDRELKAYAKDYQSKTDDNVVVAYMWDSDSGSIDNWHKFCQKQLRDSYKMLDEKIIFSNDPVSKENFSSKNLPYPLEESSIESYDRLMSVLYSEEERMKLEWAIGAIVTGDSRKLQKFIVLYGAAGTGKSTVLNIIQKLFKGYYAVFDAKALGSASHRFALEPFSKNPLVAIQHDGDLSHIEDNTRLNSLVSHEEMNVEVKNKSAFSNDFKAFLFMGTNRPVKITDSRSGILRRLIDVNPSGKKVPTAEYDRLMNNIDFELGGIAWHCREVYLNNKYIYNDYVPVRMMGASNDFYNFVADNYLIFKKQDDVTLTQAWDMYKTYCDMAKVTYPMSRRVFQEELKNYFWEYYDRTTLEDGDRVRSVFKGFKSDIFEIPEGKRKPRKEETPTESHWLVFTEQPSIFDKRFADCKAQYANSNEHPTSKWDNVTTTLKDIDTTQLHYILIPEYESLVTIDFDIPDEDGNKSFERNVKEACKWPPTYAELSKSGAGIHLEYFYTGDTSELASIFAPHIEVKVSKGNAALRRKLTKCNGMPIAKISSGLKRKEKKVTQEFEGIKSERALVDLIERNLRKEIHPGTKPSIDFIYHILDEAYNAGLKYDLTKPYENGAMLGLIFENNPGGLSDETSLADCIYEFARNSSHQSETCIRMCKQMKFKSVKDEIKEEVKEKPLVIFDIEVLPNLLLICYKEMEDIDPKWDWPRIRDAIKNHKKPIVRMFNPEPTEVGKFFDLFEIIGFNNRRYDNHICYGRYMGYSIPGCYKLSCMMIMNHTGYLREAYGKSYTDIYDFANGDKKKGLKKLEIDMGFHHQEYGHSWDQELPEEKWQEIAGYCDNDVLATELAFWWCSQDYITREILATWAGMTVNDTTNSLTTRIIFGTNRRPQDQFNYRFMGVPIESGPDEYDVPDVLDVDPAFTLFDNGKPVFPGYIFENGESWYRDEKVGEGGYVYSEPGMYGNVALLDVASMHPSSIKAEELFGPEYTDKYWSIVEARLAIKHGDFDTVRKMFGGIFAPYLDDESKAQELADALKIPINSVYGLTSAKFDNPFRDPRNVDNIVAKRGALFMINLKHEVQRRGYTVAHIKTDSIKIPNATPEIIDFVKAYGYLYGYTFEHECTYDRMCLVNDAVYIAKYASIDRCVELYGEEYVMSSKDCCKKNKKKGGKWDATGAQFAVPYVFKTMFSKENIEFLDLCVTKAAEKGELYLDMNEHLPDVTEFEKELKKLESKYRKGELSDTTFEPEYKRLTEEIAKGHNYIFIGKVGLFCPILETFGGGELVYKKEDKYYAVTGTKGYRFLETEMVENLDMMVAVNKLYFEDLVQDALDNMAKYGDVNEFINSDEPYKKLLPFMNVPIVEEEELPFV